MTASLRGDLERVDRCVTGVQIMIAPLARTSSQHINGVAMGTLNLHGVEPKSDGRCVGVDIADWPPTILAGASYWQSEPSVNTFLVRIDVLALDVASVIGSGGSQAFGRTHLAAAEFAEDTEWRFRRTCRAGVRGVADFMTTFDALSECHCALLRAANSFRRLQIIVLKRREWYRCRYT